MKLHMWSCDSEGTIFEDDEDVVIEVATLEEATAVIVRDLYETASDQFMHAALAQWFGDDNATIHMLPAGNNTFWNVTLDTQLPSW